MVIKYVFRGYMLRLTQYEVRLTSFAVRDTQYVIRLTKYVLRGYMLHVRSTWYMGIPIRLPPALCVSRSVCVCEKVLLFGFENKK